MKGKKKPKIYPRFSVLYLSKIRQSIPKENLGKYMATAMRRPKKQVVIKNIGNLKASHLKNSLNYVITNAKQSALDSSQDSQDNLSNSHLQNAIHIILVQLPLLLSMKMVM